MRKSLVLVAVFYVGMAVVLSVSLARVPLLADVASSEAVHVVVHMAMYGGFAFFVRKSGARRRTAALLTLALACAQELAQDISFGRMPGMPELFDLAVDSSAITIALTAGERLRLPGKRPGAVDVRGA
jgi:hypothetical protein